MIQAFRSIRIPIAMKDGKQIEVNIPFDLSLLKSVEETLQNSEGKGWFRIRRKDHSILEDFQVFCAKYLPKDFPYEQADPTFCAVFFSHVRNELRRSILNCIRQMNSTEESEKPTEDTTEATA
jgi:hypothetical protein